MEDMALLIQIMISLNSKDYICHYQNNLPYFVHRHEFDFLYFQYQKRNMVNILKINKNTVNAKKNPKYLILHIPADAAPSNINIIFLLLISSVCCIYLI